MCFGGPECWQFFVIICIMKTKMQIFIEPIVSHCDLARLHLLHKTCWVKSTLGSQAECKYSTWCTGTDYGTSEWCECPTRPNPALPSLTLPNLSYTDYTYSDHNEIKWNLSLDIKYTVTKNCITDRQHLRNLMCIWCIEKISLPVYS